MQPAAATGMQGPGPQREIPGRASNVPLAHFADQKTELWETSREPQVTMTQLWLISRGSQHGASALTCEGVTKAESQPRAPH